MPPPISNISDVNNFFSKIVYLDNFIVYIVYKYVWLVNVRLIPEILQFLPFQYILKMWNMTDEYEIGLPHIIL